MENNKDVIIVAEMPKMVPNEQFVLYAPLADEDTYGMVKLGNPDDEKNYLKVEDGAINLDIDKAKEDLQGDPFRYEDFTPEQLEALRGPQGLVGPQGPQGPPGTGRPLTFDDLTPNQKEELRGEKGEKGDPFMIREVYHSYEEMDQNRFTDGVPVGGFVIIDGDLEDPYTGQVFRKDPGNVYTYQVDLSGARGIQGPPGPKGEPGEKGAIIYSFYDNIEDMNSDLLNPEIPADGLVSCVVENVLTFFKKEGASYDIDKGIIDYDSEIRFVFYRYFDNEYSVVSVKIGEEYCKLTKQDADYVGTLDDGRIVKLLFVMDDIEGNDPVSIYQLTLIDTDNPNFTDVEYEVVVDEYNWAEYATAPSGLPGPRGENGKPADLRFNAGVLEMKVGDGDWKPLGAGVISLAKNVSVGEDSRAITDGSIAIGNNNTAGTRALYFSAIRYENKIIELMLSNPYTDESALLSLPENLNDLLGHEFSIINGTHYGFCGRITSIALEDYILYVGYEPTTELGTNLSREYPWWIFDVESSKEDNENHLFWIPDMPLIGYDILDYSGRPIFADAFVVGNGSKGSADDVFVAGEENVAGGNHAAIFGAKNKGSYGNFVTGRENFSTGLHSALLGRWLTNHHDYGFKVGKANVEDEGLFQFGYGTTDVRKNVFSVDKAGNGLFFGKSTAEEYIAHPKYEMTLQFRTHSEFNSDSTLISGGSRTFTWDPDAFSAAYRATGSPNWIQRYSAKGFADGKTYSHVKVRYMIPADNSEALYQAMIWRSVGVPSGDNKATPVNDGSHVISGTNVLLIADGEWHDVVYDLSAHSKWDGSKIILLRWANSKAFTCPIYVSQFGLFRSYEDAISSIPEKEVMTTESVERYLNDYIEDKLINGKW